MAFSAPIVNYADIPAVIFESETDYGLPEASITSRMDYLRANFKDEGKQAEGEWSRELTALYEAAWIAKQVVRAFVLEQKGQIFMNELQDYNVKRSKFLTRVGSTVEIKAYMKERAIIEKQQRKERKRRRQELNEERIQAAITYQQQLTAAVASAPPPSSAAVAKELANRQRIAAKRNALDKALNNALDKALALNPEKL
jgi:hypothetical protein